MTQAQVLHSSTPRSSAHTQSLRSLLIREWPFFILYALALVGVGLTDANAETSAEYWQALIPVTGLAAIAIGWSSVAPDQRTAMIFKQVLHWGALLAVTRLLFMHSVTDFLNDDADGFVVIYLLGLASILAGIHWNWRMGVFGAFLILSGVFLAYFEDFVLIIATAAAVVGIAGSLAWYAIGRKRAAAAR